METKKIVMIISIMALILFSGCSKQPIKSYKIYEFDDLHSKVENEKECFDLCKEREYNNDGRSVIEALLSNKKYSCDYEPVICENNKCLCKTY